MPATMSSQATENIRQMTSSSAAPSADQHNEMMTGTASGQDALAERDGARGQRELMDPLAARPSASTTSRPAFAV
jgi:hypothetical protein